MFFTKAAITFRRLNEDDLETVMKWRMLPYITKYMKTDPQLTMEDQYNWYQEIQADKNSFYWIVESSHKPVGLVQLYDWDKQNSTISNGSYIAELEGRTLQNIIDMHMNLFAYAIEQLGINRLPIEVMSNNIGQIQWVKRLGATQEGILRQAVKKNSTYFDIYLFSILKEEWHSIINRIHFNRLTME